MIFCVGKGETAMYGDGYHKSYRAWNKDVSSSRFEEVRILVTSILGDFKSKWDSITKDQWAKIAAIPEFDLEITKEITGLFSIPLSTEKTIEISGKSFTVSESKELIEKSQ